MQDKTVVVRDANTIALRYAQALQRRPLLTKAVTSSLLSFSSEIAAGSLSGFPLEPLKKEDRTGVWVLDWLTVNRRAVKLGVYGLVVSAPLAHYLMAALQRVFAGQTSIKAKLLMIIITNVVVNPIQQSAFIFALGRINGTREIIDLLHFWRQNIWPMMRLSWASSPLAMVFAQMYLSPEMWVPFFNFVAVAIGTVVNMRTKRRILDQMRKRAQHKPRGGDPPRARPGAGEAAT